MDGRTLFAGHARSSRAASPAQRGPYRRRGCGASPLPAAHRWLEQAQGGNAAVHGDVQSVLGAEGSKSWQQDGARRKPRPSQHALFPISTQARPLSRTAPTASAARRPSSVPHRLGCCALPAHVLPCPHATPTCRPSGVSVMTSRCVDLLQGVAAAGSGGASQANGDRPRGPIAWRPGPSTHGQRC